MEVQNLFEFGDLVRRQRERLGFELDDIALRIKIAPRMLQAIEEGALDSLPQAAFAKGFARTYAQALDMDLAEVDAMLEVVFPCSALNNVHVDMTYAGAEQRSCSNRRKQILALVLLILAGLIVAWFFLGRQSAPPAPSDAGVHAATIQNEPRRQEESVAARAVAPPAEARPSGQLSGGASPAPPGTVAAAGQTQSAGVEAPAVQAAAEPQPAESAVEERAAQRPALGEAVPESNAAITAPQAPGTHRIIIYAEKNCWVGASFDGASNRNFTLRQNQHFVLDFQSKLNLILGNGNGVKILYDGKALSFTVKRGGTAELTLPEAATH